MLVFARGERFHSLDDRENRPLMSDDFSLGIFVRGSAANAKEKSQRRSRKIPDRRHSTIRFISIHHPRE